MVSARADVSPGQKFDASNVDQIKNLISPGLEWCIKWGFPITIAETKKVEWPQAYKEATEKYAPQVKLSKDGLTVENYVAGQPFPGVDKSDPRVAQLFREAAEHGLRYGFSVPVHGGHGEGGVLSLARPQPPLPQALGERQRLFQRAQWLAAVLQTKLRGFVFEEATVRSFLRAVQRAVATWHQPQAWRRLQRIAMSRDFGWGSSARRFGTYFAAVAAGTSDTPSWSSMKAYISDNSR